MCEAPAETDHGSPAGRVPSRVQILTSSLPGRPGNAPWPIGVTSVGIHERSSREKISHVTGMNAGGEAHIMNDEATRKYLQASASSSHTACAMEHVTETAT